MAQKIQTLFIDDLDGGEADGTVRFALDGASYEIDLNPVHAGELRAVMSRYTQVARRITGPARRPGRPSRGKTADGVSTTQVRDWARQNGIEVKDRGGYRRTWSPGSRRPRQAKSSLDDVARPAPGRYLLNPPSVAADAVDDGADRPIGGWGVSSAASSLRRLAQRPDSMAAAVSRAVPAVSVAASRSWRRACAVAIQVRYRTRSRIAPGSSAARPPQSSSSAAGSPRSRKARPVSAIWLGRHIQ